MVQPLLLSSSLLSQAFAVQYFVETFLSAIICLGALPAVRRIASLADAEDATQRFTPVSPTVRSEEEPFF